MKILLLLLRAKGPVFNVSLWKALLSFYMVTSVDKGVCVYIRKFLVGIWSMWQCHGGGGSVKK